MRRRLIIVMVAVNTILAAAIFAWPAVSQVIPLSVFQDCCKEDGGEPYCCNNCCWFVDDCDSDEDCGGN